MPNDRRSDRPAISPLADRRADRRKVAAERLGGPAPVFVGHSAAAQAVRGRIAEALRGHDAVLLVGGPGTGKYKVAEILHHFGGGEARSLTPMRIDAIGGPNKACGQAGVGGFAFVSPIEQLCVERQARICDDVGFGRLDRLDHLHRLHRLVIGTRLDPDSAEGRALLSPQLVERCSIRIDLPRLSERIDDLEALVLALLHELPMMRPVGAISDDALDCLRAHDWPGNVSELEDVIIKALALGRGTQIELRDLPVELRIRDARCLRRNVSKQEFALEVAERRAILRVMRLVRGNKRMAARLLQIGKTTLYRRLSEYDAS
jgi:DNA-binding NtrC family response regulator